MNDTNFRTGIGYDIHRLVSGRPLILGGVPIAHDKGLDGHSDADVLLHAICDAILGALGLGDIGDHFPDTDESFKGISSLVLLERVYEQLLAFGYHVINVDAVLLSEKPKIQPYKKQMRSNIASRLGVQEDRVNLKATTLEGIGALGQGEGMAAYATALIAGNKE